jgi:hypothetical protein
MNIIIGIIGEETHGKIKIAKTDKFAEIQAGMQAERERIAKEGYFKRESRLPESNPDMHDDIRQDVLESQGELF